jgi:hypothetical protein
MGRAVTFLLTTRSLFSAGKSLRRRTYGKSSNSSFHSYSYVRVYVRASLSLLSMCARKRERWSGDRDSVRGWPHVASRENNHGLLLLHTVYIYGPGRGAGLSDLITHACRMHARYTYCMQYYLERSIEIDPSSIEQH